MFLGDAAVCGASIFRPKPLMRLPWWTTTTHVHGPRPVARVAACADPVVVRSTTVDTKVARVQGRIFLPCGVMEISQPEGLACSVRRGIMAGGRAWTCGLMRIVCYLLRLTKRTMRQSRTSGRISSFLECSLHWVARRAPTLMLRLRTKGCTVNLDQIGIYAPIDTSMITAIFHNGAMPRERLISTRRHDLLAWWVLFA
ncbi:hypothetical protein BV25DRAFT_1723602 [Artomyces pyxidatus]|uniref:Uncharacterized protein n=1 Tax=Artomyces pyxidatus TaxID=48021 RepID=A0ACB8SI85_9AGAM|nr:hypothetical protein BV25DRAFT_1723602 [Artomyces pyxidatus]